MRERKLMEAMNHIDEDLIREAAEAKEGSETVIPIRRKKKGFRIPSSAAAAIAVVILAGTAMGGNRIISQKKQIQQLQEQLAAQEDVAAVAATESAGEAAAGEAAEESGTVGINGGTIDSIYKTGSTYKEVYQALYDMGAVLTKQASGGTTGFLDNLLDGVFSDKGSNAPAMEEAVESVEAPAAAASDTASPSGSYSTTNVMTEGVDESDIVKTDGSYIYMVQSGSVKITDIRDGEPGESVQLTIPFESPSDRILEMYVDGGSLVVITEHAVKTDGSRYAWRSWYSDYDSQTMAYVYDLTDPMKAELVGKMTQDGSYKTSRKVGDMVYLFTNQAVRVPEDEKDAVKDENVSQWVPAVNGCPVAADCIWIPESGYYSLVVSSFRVNDPTATVDAKVILNDWCDIYVGSGHIYLYRGIWTSYQMTEITSFTYKDGKITAGFDTTVSGSITDSFAINEKNGMLRVLTTDYSGSTVNTLFILDEKLQLTGRIDEIARNEQIYAARFLGDMAYFITYENHDPLFVADLSDPSNPKLLGNVEISGFSDYLHVWDDTHILGIGYETDEDSNRKGIKLVMFDVSDPMNPVIEHTRVIRLHKQGKDDDGRWYWYYSDAISGNYKAILADPVKNLIGFAFSFDGYTDNGDISKTAYYVFSYDEKDGFDCRMDQELNAGNLTEYRGLYAGDTFYVAGCGEIRAYDMKKDFSEK